MDTGPVDGIEPADRVDRVDPVGRGDRVALGVEEEFHIVDTATGLPAPAAPGLLGQLPARTFVREFQQSVVETNSGVHATLDALRADLLRARSRLDAVAARLGLAVVAAGTVPVAASGSVDVTAAPRYAQISEEYGAVADEQLVCAAQVHVDVPDRDTAARAMGLLAPWLPVLLALSASSPLWLGADTGYASWRTLVMQRWPSAGPPGAFGSAAEYDALVDALIDGKVIRDRGMIYYDLRPSEHQQTLELRICDACPRVDTVVLIAGLFRAMVVDACRAANRDADSKGLHRHEWLRAATWRAARSGLGGDLLDPVAGRPVPAAQLVRALVDRHAAALRRFGDHECVTALAEEELASGGAAFRLRRAAAGLSLRDVVLRMAAETRDNGRPRG